MRVLQARLLAKRREEQRAEMDALKGEGGSSWGNQMRSYVLHPYQMVKDLRTEYDTGNPTAVLDGATDSFIDAGIPPRRQQETVDPSCAGRRRPPHIPVLPQPGATVRDRSPAR